MKIKIIDNGICDRLTAGKIYEVVQNFENSWNVLNDRGNLCLIYKKGDVENIVAEEVTEPCTPVTVTTKTILEIKSGPFDEVFINGGKYVLDKQ